jgi:hypothetical protein
VLILTTYRDGATREEELEDHFANGHNVQPPSMSEVMLDDAHRRAHAMDVTIQHSHPQSEGDR